MKRHVKIAISAGVFAISSVVGTVRRFIRVKHAPCLTILYYHALPLSRTANFERQMRLLARWARVVDANWDGDDAAKAQAASRYTVAITFDDAFTSVLENALPILAAHRFCCTVFVPSGCLGRPPTWDMETELDRSETVINVDQLSRLPGDLVTVGSHTVTHPHLTALRAGAARDELTQSMADLSALTRTSVQSLAFPYGDHDADIIALCQACGYKRVYTVHPAQVRPGDGEFVRGRVGVDPSDGSFEFFLKLTGSYRWVPMASFIKQRLRSLLRISTENSVTQS